jgi:hypothetical protein
MVNVIYDTPNIVDPKIYIPLNAHVDLSYPNDIKISSESFDLINVSVEDLVHIRSCMSTDRESKTIGGGDHSNWSMNYKDNKLIIRLNVNINGEMCALELPVVCDEKMMENFDRLIDVGRRIENGSLKVLSKD